MADSTADTNAASAPAMPWHILVKIDWQSDVPAEWHGSLAEWLQEQVSAHVASVALTDAQFESLFPAPLGAGVGADPAPGALSHRVFDLGTAEQAAGEPMLPMLHGHPEFVLFFDGGGHVAIA
jgi:hypothetical protein